VPRSAPKGHELGRAFPTGIPGQKGSDHGLGPSPTLRRPHRFHVPTPPNACFFLIVSFRAPLIGDSSTLVTLVDAALRSVAPHFSVASR